MSPPYIASNLQPNPRARNLKHHARSWHSFGARHQTAAQTTRRTETRPRTSLQHPELRIGRHAALTARFDQTSPPSACTACRRQRHAGHKGNLIGSACEIWIDCCYVALWCTLCNNDTRCWWFLFCVLAWRRAWLYLGCHQHWYAAHWRSICGVRYISDWCRNSAWWYHTMGHLG